ncbi:hypothetical protein [Prosthecochloris sp. SCSIO W1103]|uniref:hypothetical protein n=1 Tax=Prosthecochloris sp. SCSIO W1103 TaxID=2992244 RepID=UPI00223D15B5|nr:hypothetical protein [Prosthecochloris sp. SCSIO W1103]UZJ37491.1 hypothetical protein OO005_12210 [Prosthecochloris sp. SCSIO W1103]
MHHGEYIEQIILNQRKAIIYHSVLGGFLLLVGIGIIIFAIFKDTHNSDAINTIVGLAGAYVFSNSLLPLKEIISRHERIGVFKAIKNQGDEVSEKEKEKIDQLLEKALEKIVTE